MTAHPNDWQQRYHEAVRALAEAWQDGYSNGRFDEREDPRWISPTRNPYLKGI